MYGTPKTVTAPAFTQDKFKIGHVLVKDGQFYGTIVLIEGNDPCRFYGIRSPSHMGISMVRKQVLESKKEYPGLEILSIE